MKKGILLLTGLFTMTFGAAVTYANYPKFQSANTNVQQPTQGIRFGEDVTGAKVSLSLKPYPSNLELFPGVTDIPKTPVTVTLPVYPGASPTAESFPEAPASVLMTPYLVVNKAEYNLPVHTVVAEKWFAEHLTALGYENGGSGSAGNTKTGVFSTFLMFNYLKDGNLTLELSFKANGKDQTLFQYWAQYILIPERPKDSMIPNDITKAEITYGKPTGQNMNQKTTITNSRVLAELIHNINSFPRSIDGIGGCTMDDGTRANITFITSHNQTIHVIENPACRIVTINDGKALFDKNHYVSDRVSELVKSK